MDKLTSLSQLRQHCFDTTNVIISLARIILFTFITIIIKIV